MNGGYQWLGEFAYSGGVSNASTRARIIEVLNRALNGLSLKPLRVSIKMSQILPPIETYAGIVSFNPDPNNLQIKVKVDSRLGIDAENLYITLNANGNYIFETN